MKLVELLAAGVNGAENGTATFVLRGTASSAASVLYSDFEGTSQPGTNIITLDSHGAAEVYTNAYCDVTLKTSAGSILRTVTVGNTATTTEVISDSFTGTDYSGSPTAVSEPIALSAVLDKWNNSAGANDWKVAVNGVSTNISSAFSALAGIFVNVKDPTYGAVGDGTTDDTTAIGLAITAAVAAGGGIVFFPPTTSFYKFTTLTLSSNNITLMGAGLLASTLKSSSTSTVITISGRVTLSGLAITGTGASANPLIQFSSGADVVVEDCSLTALSFTGDLIKKTSGSTKTAVVLNRCILTGGASVANFVNNGASDNAVFWNITKCRFILTAGFVGNVLAGPDFIASDNVFDGSAVTSGTYIHVVAVSNVTAGKYIGQFNNNRFIDGGSSGYCFWLAVIATGSDFVENNNVFQGFTATTSLATADNIYAVSHNSQDAYRVVLGSRKGRTIELTHSVAGTITLLAFASYENVFVNYTAAGNSTLKAPITVMTNGCECNLVLQNNDASQRDIVIDYGETPQTYGPQAATSGSDLTLQPQNGERVVVFMKFMHFGTGAPLAFAPVPVED